MRKTKIKLLTFFVTMLTILIFIKASAQDYCGDANCVETVIAGAEISSDIKAKIEQNKPIYQEAAKQVGIPWQMLAAVHFREGGCSPEKSPVSGEKLGTKNPDNGTVYTTLEEATLAAANFLKNKAKSVYKMELNENPNDDAIGYAFLAYNRGYMYRDGLDKNGNSCPGQPKNTPYDKSPYVVNLLDGQHQNMTWNGCIDSGMTHADSNIGAMTIYKLLKNDDCVSGESVDKAALDASLKEMLSSGAYGGNGNAVNKYLETFEVTVWNGTSEVKRKITAHKLVVGSLKSIFSELTKMKYPIVTLGCFREAQGASSGNSSSISAHRFGIACDINENYNFGDCGNGPYKVTPEVATVFEKHGWPIWGLCKEQCGMGDFNTFCDGMHFSTQEPSVPGIMK
ncbi:MAG: M15 family metallopeptidase [Candidatus Pacebacteria bacterium]|nr:M15 family metallopeptidase [Candidatus Paceibacterota bacterium]